MGCTPGGLAQIARARGTKAALKQLVAEAAERVAGYPRVIARVVHTDEPDLGQEVAARLRAAVPGAEVKVSEASAVSGPRGGPGPWAFAIRASTPASPSPNPGRRRWAVLHNPPIRPAKGSTSKRPITPGRFVRYHYLVIGLQQWVFTLNGILQGVCGRKFACSLRPARR